MARRGAPAQGAAAPAWGCRPAAPPARLQEPSRPSALGSPPGRPWPFLPDPDSSSPYRSPAPQISPQHPEFLSDASKAAQPPRIPSHPPGCLPKPQFLPNAPGFSPAPQIPPWQPGFVPNVRCFAPTPRIPLQYPSPNLLIARSRWFLTSSRISPELGDFALAPHLLPAPPAPPLPPAPSGPRIHFARGSRDPLPRQERAFPGSSPHQRRSENLQAPCLPHLPLRFGVGCSLPRTRCRWPQCWLPSPLRVGGPQEILTGLPHPARRFFPFLVAEVGGGGRGGRGGGAVMTPRQAGGPGCGFQPAGVGRWVQGAPAWASVSSSG